MYQEKLQLAFIDTNLEKLKEEHDNENINTFINDGIRETVEKYGVEVLSNAQLLAAILDIRNSNKNKLEVVNNIINADDGISTLKSTTIEELGKIIGKKNALKIKMLLELSHRINVYKKYQSKISSPSDAADLVMEDMRYLKKEYLKILYLNTKNVVISSAIISIGNLNSSIVHPREVYTEAIKKSAASIIIIHNHPSGDSTESQEDINITKRLYEVGKLVGIELIDHLIIGDGTFVSLKEKGIL